MAKKANSFCSSPDIKSRLSNSTCGWYCLSLLQALNNFALPSAAEPIRTNDPYGKKFPERVYIILKEDTPDLPVAGLEETNLLPSESDTLEIQSDSSKEVTVCDFTDEYDLRLIFLLF